MKCFLHAVKFVVLVNVLLMENSFSGGNRKNAFYPALNSTIFRVYYAKGST